MEFQPAQRRPSESTPFARFPVELVCSVMEMAARDCRNFAVTLTLVSRTVHYWITPILYRTVLLPSRLAADRFHCGLGRAIDYDWGAEPNFAGPTNVRNICLSHEDERDNLGLTILTKCPGVERLVLDIHATSWDRKEVDRTWPWPAPWEVSVTAYDSGDWLAHPVLRNVTHLYLQMPALRSGKDSLPAILSLQRLTHLSLGSYWAGLELVRLTQRLLEARPSLEMILLHSLPKVGRVGQLWAEFAKIEDERLLVMPGIGVDEFGELLKSERTIWDDARGQCKDWRDGVNA